MIPIRGLRSPVAAPAVPIARRFSVFDRRRQNWSADRERLLAEMWHAGEPVRVIAEALGGGISPSSVSGKAHRMGLPRRTNPVAGVR